MEFIIPVIIEGYRTLKDRTIKITIETNELDADKQQAVFRNIQEAGFLAFKREKFTKREIELLDSLKADTEVVGKTKSQRQRSVLYILWQQDNAGYDDFEVKVDVQL